MPPSSDAVVVAGGLGTTQMKLFHFVQVLQHMSFYRTRWFPDSADLITRYPNFQSSMFSSFVSVLLWIDVPLESKEAMGSFLTKQGLPENFVPALLQQSIKKF
ncbi:hypothetical protein KSP39_PZI001297 [Platanthera zijinensis]|uniref:Uncharacterized protein n=1 Tax=Platanthera zijinensis TaxID=2320716 RepID=A0AAP0C467_9ASPA